MDSIETRIAQDGTSEWVLTVLDRRWRLKEFGTFYGVYSPGCQTRMARMLNTCLRIVSSHWARLLLNLDFVSIDTPWFRQKTLNTNSNGQFDYEPPITVLQDFCDQTGT